MEVLLSGDQANVCKKPSKPPVGEMPPPIPSHTLAWAHEPSCKMRSEAELRGRESSSGRAAVLLVSFSQPRHPSSPAAQVCDLTRRSSDLSTTRKPRGAHRVLSWCHTPTWSLSLQARRRVEARPARSSPLCHSASLFCPHRTQCAASPSVLSAKSSWGEQDRQHASASSGLNPL